MLPLKIPGKESWDAAKEEFVYTKPTLLSLEHSLVSVSKWEARWGRSFLADPPKTRAEWLDYARCMTLTQNVPPEVYASFTQKEFNAIQAYIDAPMTATTIKQKKNTRGSKVTTVTSEIIYYWMIELGIPFECQKWHLNRLMTLIRVCDIKSGPQKKMSQKDILRDNMRLNKQRRARLNSRG